MFFFQGKDKEVQIHTIQIIQMRDEWGVLQKMCLIRDASLLTDQELADKCEIGIATVQKHQRD